MAGEGFELEAELAAVSAELWQEVDDGLQAELRRDRAFRALYGQVSRDMAEYTKEEQQAIYLAKFFETEHTSEWPTLTRNP